LPYLTNQYLFIMKLLKSNPTLSIANRFVVDSSSPSNLFFPCGTRISGLAACMGVFRGYAKNPNFDPSIVGLSSVQQETIVGGLLGDLSIQRAKPTHNSRLYISVF
jgi:hypothetical protein